MPFRLGPDLFFCNLSISIFRDSFGENDENCVRPLIPETVPEKVVAYKSAPTVTQPPSSHIVTVAKDRRSHHVQHSGPSPLVIFGHFRSGK